MTTATDPTHITHRKVSVPGNFERRAFMFMRLSGALLLFLAVGHMMIQHVLNSSGNLTIQFVAGQWKSWGWKVYDMMLLIFAITHGFNGLRNILGDYIHKESTMKTIGIIIAVFCVITIIWAGFAISAFDPASVR